MERSGDQTIEPTSPALSLSSRLLEPLSSTVQLLDLLVPPLLALDLLPDVSPAFLSRYRLPTTLSIDPSRFLKRQLGLVQKVLVEKVWPDWEKAVEAEEGTDGLLVFERWFVPPSTSSTSSTIAAEVAQSSYAILSAVLSGKSAPTLQTRSLEIVSSLLIKLNTSFNLSELYLSSLGTSPPSSVTVTEDSDSEDEEDRIDPASLAMWEQSIKDLMGIPVRVANAWGLQSEKKGTRVGERIPAELEDENYSSSLTRSYLSLLWSLSSPSSSTPVFHSALSTPLKSLLPSPSFLTTSLPLLVPRILPPTTFPTPANDLIHRQRYIDLLRKTTAELPDRDLSRFLRNLLSKLTKDHKNLSASNSTISPKGASFVLSNLFGPLEPSTSSSTWKAALEVLLDRNCDWDSELVPKIVVCWLDGEEKLIVAMLDKVKEVWGATEELKSGFESRRTYLTSLLLVLIASLPQMHPSLVSLSRSPLFLSAVSSSLSSVSPLSRLLGMLAAEYVSNRSLDPNAGVQALDFGSGIWDGDGFEKEKIRELRGILKEVEKGFQVEGWKEVLRKTYAQDTDTIRAIPPVGSGLKHNPKPLKPTSVEEPTPGRPKRPLISIVGSDDEDDEEEELNAYPLPPRPSDATLEALSSSDPSLYQSTYSTPSTHPSQSRRRGKLRPPVYVFELTEYLRGKDPDGGSNGQKKEEADQEAERVEMALKEGEGLIRRKAGWGNELKENAVNLAIALMSLQDNYELDNFEQSRQRLLVALIAGCPVEVAPCVIEHYFLPSYSISQLHTFLTSLALAARELANLPIPSLLTSTPALPKPQDALFPSKQLPPALHQRLVSSQPQDQLQVLASDLTNLALSDAREDAETTIPGAAREKLLSVKRFNSKSSALSKPVDTPSTPTYTTLCAEYFILPLLNRFWLYLRDMATSTLYSRSSGSKGSYSGGRGTPTILQPLLLSKYLATVSILLHAARHAPTFLAVLAPESLALVASLRPPASTPSTHVARTEDDPGQVDEDLVLSAEMELILLILSSSHSLDGGQTLTRSSFELLSEAQSWAEEVFEAEEAKSGGAAVGRAGRAAAGVLLRLEEILGRWRGRVGWE